MTTRPGAGPSERLPGGAARTPRVRHGLPALLAATADHPFVRWEVTDDLAATWWELHGAVAFRRVRQSGGSYLALLGADHGVEGLLHHLPALAANVGTQAPASVVGVSLPQHLEPRLREQHRLLPGGDWEWFHTTRAPEADDAHEKVRPVDDVARADEIAAFLRRHSPTADTEPGHGERWFAVEAENGSLAAVAAWGHTRAGAPHLSSVAVDAGLRRRGLGRSVVGALTRWAVLETGVCTLGMYSENAEARRLYESLGYVTACAWSSRTVVLDGCPAGRA